MGHNLVKMIDLDAFHQEIERETTKDMCPRAALIEKNIPIYDGGDVDDDIRSEWAEILNKGSGVFVIKRGFASLDAIDAASDVYRQIIIDERNAGIAASDHFAKAGANDRIWNSLQKLCLAAPQIYVEYVANPVIDIAMRAWLGPGYQFASQLNQVRPGGKAQASHRDYHLGFMSPQQLETYPAHIHAASPQLLLQGGVAHCHVPLNSGPTKFLPFSQTYLPGFIAATRPEFRAYFEEHFVQLPLEKGDVVFFNPALFHAAGENTSQDIARMVNLIQACSPLARAMESIDRTAMARAIYPHLAKMPEEKARLIIAMTADGYSFPTNLDLDPPLYGLAPETHQDIMLRAYQENWSQEKLDQALLERNKKRVA